jgi:membrane-associated phospholipid phosphatase
LCFYHQLTQNKEVVHNKSRLVDFSNKRLINTFLLFFGLVLMLLAWMVADSNALSGLELSVFRYLNNLPIAFAYIFVALSFLGTYFAVFLAVTILIILRRYHFAWQVFIVGSLAWMSATLLKMLQIRDRPYRLLSNVHVYEHKDFTSGFPSAHAALAAAIGLTLFVKSPILIRWLLILAIILVGISRIVLGVHAPLDVIGGFGIGVIIASILNLLMKYLPQDKIRQKNKNYAK